MANIKEQETILGQLRATKEMQEQNVKRRGLYAEREKERKVVATNKKPTI